MDICKLVHNWQPSRSIEQGRGYLGLRSSEVCHVLHSEYALSLFHYVPFFAGYMYGNPLVCLHIPSNVTYKEDIAMKRKQVVFL